MAQQSLTPSPPSLIPSNSYSSLTNETTQYEEDETTALLSIPNSSMSGTTSTSVNSHQYYGTVSNQSISSNNVTDINVEEGNSELRHQRQNREETNTTTNNNNVENSSEEEEEPRDGVIGSLTRRLRCLFSTITWPIVPLGTIVSIALLWVLYAASSLDLRKSCSHPMHSYALISLILVSYIPNHSQVRSRLFHYSRERDGPIRPAR